MTSSRVDPARRLEGDMRHDPNQLRWEIRDAQLKVVLDRQRGIETPAPVLKLAAMELPPLVRPTQHPGQGHQNTVPPVEQRPQRPKSVTGARRREILAARLQLTFAELLGRDVPASTKQLSGAELQPLGGLAERVRDR